MSKLSHSGDADMDAIEREGRRLDEQEARQTPYAPKVFSGSIAALKEVARLQTHLRRIEDMTRTGDDDPDYMNICDRVNDIAKEALFGKD